MNGIKRYNVVVTQRTEEEYVFSYNIIPPPITELWEKVVLSSIENNLELRPFSHVKCNTPQEILDQINFHIDCLPFEIITSNIPEKIEDLTSKFLNELHQTFHHYMGNYLGENYKEWQWNLMTKKHKRHIQSLNSIVHELEYFDKDNDFNIIKIIWDIDDPYTQPISDDLYPYWNYSWGEIGDLRLGYATFGKTLFDCFLSNDINVIESKMVRPQIDIHSEAYLIFIRHPSDIKEHHKMSIEEYKKHKEFPKYIQWCDDNNVSEYKYDPLEPQHKYIGRPLLGKLDKEINLDFVKDIVCGYTNIRVEIE